MNDLLQATGYAAIVYLLFNYLVSFGSGRPLVEWINPGRRYLPFLAMALFSGAYGMLRFAVAKYQATHLDLLHKLINEEKAPPEVLGAVSFLVFGLSVVMLAIWCWWHLPRDPRTFNPNPKELTAEYRRALRHFVRWKGGLDFAVLCETRKGVLSVIAEGASDKCLKRGIARLPNDINNSTIEEQKSQYREQAALLFSQWSKFDESLRPARQGNNVAICFDLRYGACYVEMLEEETGPETSHPVGLFLFAASLNQYEVSSMNAGKHFNLLSQALRHIRSGVTKG